MYAKYLSIHKHHALASIANKIHKHGFVLRGDWTVKGNYHTVVDNLIRKFREAEKEIRNKKEDKYL